jgi:myo-inositol 2-dehydrogenase / D-chiro-inositol 1-dehydrogenase
VSTGSTLRVGIIGTGIMGAGHAHFLTDHIPAATVTALYDVDTKRAEALAGELGGSITIHSSVEALFDDPGIDAAIICSPDGLHVQHQRLAIKRGIPTLCEKPIATSVADARAIASEIAAYEKAKGKTMIHFGFMRRFDPGFVELKKKMHSGIYGKPLYIRVTARNVSSNGIISPGLFTNIAVHDFDIIRWMTGDTWREVSSFYPPRSTQGDPGVGDPLVFVARGDKGFLFVEDVFAYGNYGYDVRYEAVCENGAIELANHGDVITRHNQEAGSPKAGIMDKNWIPRFEKAYIEELRAWVTAITTGVDNPDLARAEDALKAAEACQLGVASLPHVG